MAEAWIHPWLRQLGGKRHGEHWPTVYVVRDGAIYHFAAYDDVGSAVETASALKDHFGAMPFVAGYGNWFGDKCPAALRLPTRFLPFDRDAIRRP
jgi:hypothetical protein